MTYSLPFGLKQKPVNHYLKNGVVKFSCREGKLFCEVKSITKTRTASIMKEEIPNKRILDQLLAMKSIDELWDSKSGKHVLEVVN